MKAEFQGIVEGEVLKNINHINSQLKELMKKDNFFQAVLKGVLVNIWIPFLFLKMLLIITLFIILSFSLQTNEYNFLNYILLGLGIFVSNYFEVTSKKHFNPYNIKKFPDIYLKDCISEHLLKTFPYKHFNSNKMCSFLDGLTLKQKEVLKFIDEHKLYLIPSEKSNFAFFIEKLKTCTDKEYIENKRKIKLYISLYEDENYQDVANEMIEKHFKHLNK